MGIDNLGTMLYHIDTRMYQFMQNFKDKYPRTRIKPAAWEWLKAQYIAYKQLGLDRSYTDIASEAILSFPMPTNGNGHKPADCPPCEEEGEGK